MTKITIKQIEEMIESFAGSEGVLIYRILKGKQDVDEFIIAEKLKMTINQIRNLLYRFELKNLIDSTRRKDKKKGWYVYFFTFKDSEAEHQVIESKKAVLLKLKQKIQSESEDDFYECANKCVKMDSEEALEHNYMCPECGQILEQEELKPFKKLEARVEELQKEIDELKSEVAKKREKSAVIAEEEEKKKIQAKKIAIKAEAKKRVLAKKESKNAEAKKKENLGKVQAKKPAVSLGNGKKNAKAQSVKKDLSKKKAVNVKKK